MIDLNENKLKILHVINSFETGGAENLLANSLAPGGLCEFTDSHLVYFKGHTDLINRTDPKLKIYCLEYSGKTNLLTMLWKLKQYIALHKFDLIHTHLNPSGLYTHLVAPTNIPQVHTIHSTYSQVTHTGQLRLFLEKYGYFKSSRCNLICLSDFAKQDFLNTIRFRGQMFVVNNFVDGKYFSETPKKYSSTNKSLRIVAVGMIKYVKNYEYLLEVLKHCADSEIYLDIYGGGDQRALQQKIKENKLKVRLLGEHANIASVLRQYDLFIMPSRHESFGLSLFESMATGLPALISDIASFRFLVKDNALFMDLKDPASAASMIKKIFSGSIDIDSIARKGWVLANSLARRERYIVEILRIYSQIVGSS